MSRTEPDEAVFQDLQAYFILKKYKVPIHLWNHRNNHTTVVLKQNSKLWLMSWKALTPITAWLIHIIIVIDCSVTIWKVTMFQFTTTAVTLVVLTWSVYMKCRLVLVQIKTILSKGSIQWGPTINVDSNGQTIKSGKEHYCDI